MNNKDKGLKTKLTEEEFNQIRGTRAAHQYKYNEDSKKWEKNLRKIRSLLKAFNKSPKFLLLVDGALAKRHYLNKEGELVTQRKAARQFAYGFDEPARILELYSNKLGIKFKVENYGKEEERKQRE